ncbi:MAG: hypothetical protein UY44_C0006G0022 [Candidatus Kaiserbacteria bacterium GW2011_GWA2_49_19]|uniref:Uncharacterized protein n=1 Tax=Candidatus Kaiserbacteria bacterium GW2011_GWA2_49_19 TaxID=1618669 RepID=A0A0G1Y1Z1_9BACT|nr:MAG: hypothetical protein UY44_C0006G0022 [Candidatus Kaiserbacteria bacterium GW2011_GWA2_49_19]
MVCCIPRVEETLRTDQEDSMGAALMEDILGKQWRFMKCAPIILRPSPINS